jgi:hypothetical protein
MSDVAQPLLLAHILSALTELNLSMLVRMYNAARNALGQRIGQNDDCHDCHDWLMFQRILFVTTPAIVD